MSSRRPSTSATAGLATLLVAVLADTATSPVPSPALDTGAGQHITMDLGTKSGARV